ncbi:17447_t:CDS:2, partial [Cetraspora pellucida]
SVTLENGSIIRATDNFYEKAWYSNVAVAMNSEELFEYLSDQEICYKQLMPYNILQKMDQSDINGDNLNEINNNDEVNDNLNEINSCDEVDDNLNEINNYDEVDDNLNKINSCDEIDEDVQGNISSHAKITKRRLLEMLMISKAAFEQASKLYTGIKFDHWNHANLVLLAYGQWNGFVW